MGSFVKDLDRELWEFIMKPGEIYNYKTILNVHLFFKTRNQKDKKEEK